jgi:hypothetical protein
VSALMCRGCEQVDPINPVEDPMNGDIPLDRMKAEIIAYQCLEHDTLVNSKLTLIKKAKYNHHMSRHVQSCFKCWGKKNHACGSKCECRYRVPDCKRDRSVLKEHDELKSWFRWDRTDVPRKNSEYLIKRLRYDVFQNVSCAPLDKWPGGSNNNARPMVDGPTAQYTFKYNYKDNTKDDTEAHEKLNERMKKALVEEERKHDLEFAKFDCPISVLS